MSNSRKKRRKPRPERTAYQIASTCKSEAEAHSKGVEVHRAYLQQKVERMDPVSRMVLAEIVKQLSVIPDEQKQIEYITRIKNAKDQEELVNIIEEMERGNNGKQIIDDKKSE